MIDFSKIQIDHFIEKLRTIYHENYGSLEPEYPNICVWAARMSLENISNSDALYHNTEHTILVSLVGLQILKGKHLIEGGVSPKDWLHFTMSLLCHDIGYVHGICSKDTIDSFDNGKGEMVNLKPGATDASLTPYHIDRGKLFVKERFSGNQHINASVIMKNIENTRFPVPDKDDDDSTNDYPGLLRAADLIGQLADPGYLRKMPALFYEFEEMGANQKFGYKNPGDLRKGYAKFFWHAVHPYIQDGLRHLRATQEGYQWIANLFSHVFEIEHEWGLSIREKYKD